MTDQSVGEVGARLRALITQWIEDEKARLAEAYKLPYDLPRQRITSAAITAYERVLKELDALLSAPVVNSELPLEALDDACHCGKYPEGEWVFGTKCPVIEHRARSGAQWRKSYLELDELRRLSAPVGSLPTNVSVVRCEHGGVQIEGHTLTSDWELELDSDGNVIESDGIPSAPVGSPPQERCPHCSFDPTSMNDFCDKHRPKASAPRGGGETRPLEAAMRGLDELSAKMAAMGIVPPCPGCVSENGRVDPDCIHCHGTGRGDIRPEPKP